MMPSGAVAGRPADRAVVPPPRMSADDEPAAGFSLRRWSRRKLEAARDLPGAKPLPPAGAPADPRDVVPAAPAAPATTTATTTAKATAPATSGGGATPPATVLAPVETLTFDSDFTAYLQPEVGEALRRDALRKLFRDPRFNVMDGLDVYIDDYSIPDPISPEMVRELMHSRYLFDPPQTRINAAGEVEDVPAAERVPAAGRTAANAPAAIAAADGASAPVPAPTALPAAGGDTVAPQTATLTALSAAPDAAVPEITPPNGAVRDAAAPIHLHAAPRPDR